MVQHTSISSVPTATTVVPALRRASAATGVDFNFLLAQARSESSLNPHAQASTSSARGLFQFIDSTWLDVIDKHGAKHGLDAAAASISRDRKGRLSVADPAQRSAILKLRDDPYISGLMAAELVQDNAAKLQQELGRAVKPAELYMAHFLGAGGASSFLSRLEENPDTKAEQVVPAAARANQAVFYKSGQSLSLDEVYARFEHKFSDLTPVLTAEVTPQPHPLPGPASANRNTASSVAQAAMFAAHQPLQLGAEDTNDSRIAPLLQVTGSSPGSRSTLLQAFTPAAHPTAAVARPDSATTALLARRVLQSLVLPGHEDQPYEQIWRA